MECSLRDLRDKEVISVADGSRYGWVGDVEVDLDSGQDRALVVPGRLRLFGLLGREEDVAIPWDAIEKVGDDIILVRQAQLPALPRPPRRRRF